MKTHARKLTLAFLSLAAAAAVLSACNTVKGVGKDITYAGEKTEEAITGGSSDAPAKK